VTSSGRPRPATGTVDPTQMLAMRLAGAAVLITLILALYARSLDLLRTDVPLRASNGRFFWFACLVASGAFGFGVQRMSMRPQPTVGPTRHVPDAATAGATILPAMVMFAALQLVAWDSRIAVVVSAPLLAGVGVFTALVVRHYLLSGDPAVRPGARLVHVVLTSGVAFLTLSLARNWMAGPRYTLVIVFVIAGLLLFQAFDGIRAFPIRRAAYALAGGSVVGEAALALNYWPPSGWYAGAMLTAAFVVLMLVIEAILARSISTEVVARYVGAGVGVCGLLAILAQ
jgi:hypothetical protein